MPEINDLYAQIVQCDRICAGEKAKGAVRDGGNEGAGVIFLGEAPGAEEIKQGRPFTGQAGAKLEGYLKLAGLMRKDIFIINTVKCRPTKNNGKANRRPTVGEIKCCSYWLDEELKLLAPKVVVTLGDVALQRMGGGKRKLADCHGKAFIAEEYVVYPLYHPAAAIYRRDLEATIVEDFQLLGEWIKSNI